MRTASEAKADYLSFIQAYEAADEPTHVLSGNQALTENSMRCERV
jgi:NtrC-family two-component system sensor histidine kinase KinB